MQKPGSPTVAPNRNVVSRRVARPRNEARTTEFDCSGIAALYDARSPAPSEADDATSDLEAEIEIHEGAAAAAAPLDTGPARLAHTLRRPGTENGAAAGLSSGPPIADVARGSQPFALPLAAPSPTPLDTAAALAEAEAMADEAPTPAITTAMSADLIGSLADQTALAEPDAAHELARPARAAWTWWVVGVLAFVASALALALALRA